MDRIDPITTRKEDTQMKKSLISVLLLALMLTALFGSCVSKTPDVVASEMAESFDPNTVVWSFAVEGADVDTYTVDQARTHELSKVIHSGTLYLDEPDGNGCMEYFQTFMVEGISVAEFLADVGKPDATTITYYGTDGQGFDVEQTVEADVFNSDDVKIVWIRNKTQEMPNCPANVGLYGSTKLGDDFVTCQSLTKIVIG